jgi:hypothetical protein
MSLTGDKIWVLGYELKTNLHSGNPFLSANEKGISLQEDKSTDRIQFWGCWGDVKRVLHNHETFNKPVTLSVPYT